MPLERRAYGFRVLHVTRDLLVERPAKDVECLRGNSVAVQRIRQRRRISARRYLGGVKRDAGVAPGRDVIRREVERVSEDGLFDDLVVVRLANVPVYRQRVRRCSLEAEPGLEQRAVEIAHAAPGRVSVYLARSEY